MVAKIFLVMGEMIRADIKRAHAMDFGCSNHASAEHPKYVSLKSPGLTWTLELISGALEFFLSFPCSRYSPLKQGIFFDQTHLFWHHIR